MSDAAASARVHGLLARQRATVATAESLTGGMVAAALTDRSGASAVFRGGLVVYATDLKALLAGVPGDLLAAHGPVSGPTAAALAAGVRERLGATYGLATTGVAGPDRQDGMEVGTVFLGLAGAGPEPLVRRLALAGDRDRIRHETVAAALNWLADTLENDVRRESGA